MKERIMNVLSSARMAMSNVYVKEEQNCLNLGGAMQMVREVLEILERCDIVLMEDPEQNRKE
ncbi:MAG: hypothetical protein J6S14_17210 [Clostridia bacterium]|nr:hypothetical protein [Clostridia bacterium]